MNRLGSSTNRLMPAVRICLVMTTSVLLAGPARGADDATPLRLIGSVNGAEFSSIVAENYQLCVRVVDGSRQPVPRATRWRLEGDLFAHREHVYLLPPFIVATRPGVPLGSGPVSRTYAIIFSGQGWPWDNDRGANGGVAVFVWLVDGRVVRVLPVVANSRAGSARDLLGIVAFELADNERRGRPAMLMLRDGQWLTAKRWFADAKIDDAFSNLVLGKEADFAGAMQDLPPDKIRTQLNDHVLLSEVVDGGFAGATRWLLTQGAKPDMRDSYDHSALETAAADGHREVAEILLAAGARPFVRDYKHRTAFSEAIEYGHLAIAEDFLGAKPGWGSLCDVFRLALEQDDLPIIDKLLDRGRERLVRAMRPEDFRYCLARANEDLVQRLIAMGLKTDHEDLLLPAAFSGNAKIVKALLDQGARVNRTADDGTTALFVAAAQGHLEVVDVLLSAGAKADLVNKLSESPLGLATRHGHADVAARLRAAGAQDVTPRSSGKRRDPKVRWIGDLVSDESALVFGEDEVDRPPVVRQAAKPEVLLQLRPVGGAVTQTEVSVDPLTGQMHQWTRVYPGSSYTTTSEGGDWAVASVIVERDGSVRHASVIDASSEQFGISADRVLEDYVFEPGERNGQPVRTRVTLPIMLYN